MISVSRPCRLAPMLLLAAGGCYAYVAPPDPGPAGLVGQSVQATLTDSGSVMLASRLGPSVEVVRGRVTADSPTTVTLAMEESVRRDGTGSTWARERVDFPRVLVRSVEVRRFSPSRTTFAAGLVAVALVALERGFHGGGANSVGTSPTGTPVSK